MRRVGPQPPDPEWDRLDFRNPNGSRQAWGYLDPTDRVIVTNDGEVYVRVGKEQLEMKKDKPPTATFASSIRSLLRRTFRWVSIIRRMYDFEEERPPQVVPIKPDEEYPTKDKRHLKRWKQRDR